MTNLLSLGKHWAIEPDAFNNLMALSTNDARPLANTRMVTVRNGVAIIPIHGVITARANFMTFLFGGTSLDSLAKDFQKAIDDPEIKAVIFDFDSPGGIAVGPAEMAEIIHKTKGKKDIISYVGRHCCSAAYWLASATDKIIAHPSAMLGSIGVVSAIPVQENPDSDGYRTIEVVSSNAKSKRPDPRTPDGLAEISRELDAIETEFINDIAKYRNIDSDKVRSDFGNGGTFIGHEAVTRNMADELGSFDDVLNNLSKTYKGVNMDKEKSQSSAIPEITADLIKKEHPNIADAISKEAYDKGKADGIASERDRILAIESVAMVGHDDLVAKAKADSSMTAEKLAVEMVKIEKTRGSDHIANIMKAESELPKVSASTGAVEEIYSELPIEDRAKAEWNKSTDLRKEFANDFEDYLSFRQAQEQGLVKIFSRKRED